MLKNRKYLLLSFFFSILILILFPLFQLLPVISQNQNNLWFGLKNWFSLLTPLKWFLYFLYGILFGLTISFFVWQRKKRVCPGATMIKSGFLGGLGATLGPILPFCPACFSLVGFFLPLATLTLLIKYSNLLMLGSIALLFFSLWLLGAFKNHIRPKNVLIENIMNKKHKVELFSAECRLCKATADILEKELKQMPKIDFVIHKASECVDGECCRLAESYGVFAVPSLVIDRKLVRVGIIKNFEEISNYLK